MLSDAGRQATRAAFSSLWSIIQSQGLGCGCLWDHYSPHYTVSGSGQQPHGSEGSRGNRMVWVESAWRTMPVISIPLLHCGHVPGLCPTSAPYFSRPTPRGGYLSAAAYGGVHRHSVAGRSPPEGSDRLDELGLTGKGTKPLHPPHQLPKASATPNLQSCSPLLSCYIVSLSQLDQCFQIQSLIILKKQNRPL